MAAEVGFSEAALYRHFPSKAKMIDGLIEFAEETIFSRVARIVDERPTAAERCSGVLWLLLKFCETNPGFARLFAGDALQGETERLRVRTRQFYDRIETELRQILREHAIRRDTVAPLSPNATANLLLACVEGRINQFVRSEFKLSPTQDWPEQWRTLAGALL